MNAKPWTILTALLALAHSAQEATALGTAFSYQGSLTDNGNAATGNYVSSHLGFSHHKAEPIQNLDAA